MSERRIYCCRRLWFWFLKFVNFLAGSATWFSSFFCHHPRKAISSPLFYPFRFGEKKFQEHLIVIKIGNKFCPMNALVVGLVLYARISCLLVRTSRQSWNLGKVRQFVHSEDWFLRSTGRQMGDSVDDFGSFVDLCLPRTNLPSSCFGDRRVRLACGVRRRAW